MLNKVKGDAKDPVLRLVLYKITHGLHRLKARPDIPVARMYPMYETWICLFCFVPSFRSLDHLIKLNIVAGWVVVFLEIAMYTHYYTLHVLS